MEECDLHQDLYLHHPCPGTDTSGGGQQGGGRLVGQSADPKGGSRSLFQPKPCGTEAIEDSDWLADLG